MTEGSLSWILTKVADDRCRVEITDGLGTSSFDYSTENGKPMLIGAGFRTKDKSQPFRAGDVRELPWGMWARVARTAVLFDMPKDQIRRGEISTLPLEEIVAEYRAALMSGSKSPAADVAKARQLNPGTVRSWIHRARLQGLLDSTERGKAGG